MIPFATPLLHAGAVQGGKTYAEFVAHITALATSGERLWSTNTVVAAGSYFTTCADAAGAMIGSSWAGVFRIGSGNTNPSRIVQHGLPTTEAFADQTSNRRVVFFRVVAATAGGGFLSVDRNGFTSTSSANTALGALCDLLLFWTHEGAMQIDPYAGTGPQPYDW